MAGEVLVTVDEAARRLGMKRSFVYDLLRKDVLASVKLGSSRRVHVASIAEFAKRKLDEAMADGAYADEAREARDIGRGRGR